MSATQSDTWYPTERHIATANVTRLAANLGLDGFDALERLSVADPAAYWRAVNDYCGIVWSKPYEDYCDVSRGKEFPRFFVGGELNWSDTVFAWSQWPDSAARLAVVAESEDGTVVRVTFRELKARVDRFAAGLRARGFGRGDRIGLLMESGVEATVTLLAVASIGAIIVPLFSGFGSDAVVSRLGSCGARAFVASTGFHRRGRLVDTTPVIREAQKRVPSLELLILKPPGGTALTLAGAVEWAAVDADPGMAPTSERMSPDDPFMIIYTSGTTGRPKGTVHTHGGFPLKIAHDSAVHFDVAPGDVFCWPADMGWVAGALVICSALLRGATLVTYDGAPDFPDWSRMSRLIEAHGVTHYGSSPTLIRGLAANHPLSTASNVSSVRLLITAGEAIDPEHFMWHQRHFGRGSAPMINYTGGTEVSGALLSSVVVRPIHPAVFNAASPGVAVDVIDTEGHSVTDMVGELAILEPFVGMTQSFWQDDNRYLDTYWRTFPGKWVHGDLALRLGSGGFLLRGRSDDTLKVAGKRLGPAEVEEILLELPGIEEVAAIGVDDPAKGQKLVVFVVAADTTGVSLAERVTAHIETRLGRAFRPAQVHVVRLLPKTKSQKVMRRVIRSVYVGSPPGDLSSVDNMDAVDEIRRLCLTARQ